MARCKHQDYNKPNLSGKKTFKKNEAKYASSRVIAEAQINVGNANHRQCLLAFTFLLKGEQKNYDGHAGHFKLWNSHRHILQHSANRHQR